MATFDTRRLKLTARTAFLGFSAIVAVFLIYEHWMHLFGVLPFLLLLACPVMHMFMHHGQHGHSNHSPSGAPSMETALSKQGGHDHA